MHNAGDSGRKYQDITGWQFEDLVVDGPTGDRDKRFERLWSCRCKCGLERIASARQLKAGTAKRCSRHCRARNEAVMVEAGRLRAEAGVRAERLADLVKVEAAILAAVEALVAFRSEVIHGR